MRQTITNEGFLEIFIKNSQGIFSVGETAGRGGKKREGCQTTARERECVYARDASKRTQLDCVFMRLTSLMW